MMTVDRHIPNLWQQAMEENDEIAGRALLDRLDPFQRYEVLARTLSANIKPAPWALTMLEAQGPWDPMVGDQNWVRWVAGAELEIDWERAVRWRQSQVDADVVHHELLNGWRALWREKLGKQYPRQAQQVERGLVDLLDHEPGLVVDLLEDEDSDDDVSSVRAGGSRYATELFYLSMAQAKTDWLTRSGADPIFLVARAIKTEGNGRLFSAQATEKSVLETWVESGQGRKEAWARLQEVDQASEAAFQGWRERWIPNLRMTGSPLEAWCNRALAKTLDPQEPAPAEGLMERGESAIRKAATLWISNFSDMYPHQGQRRAAGIRIPLGEGARTRWLANDIPLDPVIGALTQGDDWAIKYVGTKEGAALLQHWLERDERTLAALRQKTPKHVMAWILKEPSWVAWRDHQNRSILDLCLLYTAATKVRVPKTIILPFARKHPELLLNISHEGKTALDWLDLDTSTRSLVNRELLGQHVEKVPKQNQPGRSARM